MKISVKRKLSKWFSETNTITFMIGLFIGIMVFNPNIIAGIGTTVLSGGLWHTVRLVLVGH